MKKLMQFFKIKNTVLIVVYILILIPIITSCKKESEDDVIPIIDPDTTMRFIGASSQKIEYSGRIDFTDPTAPEFWYPGVSIKAKFQGSAISIVLQDFSLVTPGELNYYNIFIDNKLYKVLPVNPDQYVYKIANNLIDKNHTIEIFKRTEAQIGKTVFYGFYIQKKKEMLSILFKPLRKIEFIGDSYTCGYGNEVSIAGAPNGNPLVGFHSINENNYNSWGAITARSLNAEYHCTAYSGRGLYRNNTGSTDGTLPDIYNRINPDDENSHWNKNSYVPDVIVIHLGTNDFFLEKTSDPIAVDSAAFVSTYINFITVLRNHYPLAKIVCVVPNSQTDGYPAGFKSATRIKRYTTAVTDHYAIKDINVFYLELSLNESPYGEDYHPSYASDQKMAKETISFIRSITFW